jgi:N-ethylmaleimide reductase
MAVSLFEPVRVGAFEAKNRVFMAPLTRCRADAEMAPHGLHVEYYRQRAGGGLIITEATQVTPEGQGYPFTPGMYSEKQVAGWRAVTDAVHGTGGRIFSQLWHVGRVSHNAYQPGGAAPVSSSAVALKGNVTLPDFSSQAYPTPRALETNEVAGVIEQYRRAAANALRAGFDGVELHGANGYLPDQFLRDGVNKRTDRYGGSVENRARFMLEAMRALIDVWGPERVGVRLSPSGAFNGMSDSNPKETFGYVVRELDKLRVAYVHIAEAEESDTRHGPELNTGEGGWEAIPASYFRPLFRGTLVASVGFTLERAQVYVKEGWADAVAFGKLYIANPDLAERFRLIAAGEAVGLNEPDASTFYGGGEKGYTDYPALVG